MDLREAFLVGRNVTNGTQVRLQLFELHLGRPHAQELDPVGCEVDWAQPGWDFSLAAGRAGRRPAVRRRTRARLRHLHSRHARHSLRAGRALHFLLRGLLRPGLHLHPALGAARIRIVRGLVRVHRAVVRALLFATLGLGRAAVSWRRRRGCLVHARRRRSLSLAPFARDQRHAADRAFPRMVLHDRRMHRAVVLRPGFRGRREMESSEIVDDRRDRCEGHQPDEYPAHDRHRVRAARRSLLALFEVLARMLHARQVWEVVLFIGH